MNVEMIKYPDEQDWMICKMCALETIGKEAKTQPDAEWKHKMLEARHSPIRELRYYFKLTNIPYFVAMHLVRHHVGCQPYVKTQRTDRTGTNRNELPQNAPVNMIWRLNGESLQTIANKRLCMQASPETREVVQEMCRAVIEKCPEFEGLLVPMCEYQGGVCHEIWPCGKYKNMRLLCEVEK